MGKNKQPFFRVVATDSRRPRDGRFLEALGWYDPKKKTADCELKLDRIEYWRSRGAELSDTVRMLVGKRRKDAARKAVAAAPAAGGEGG
jgi:small subunit ribosomal protein S16